MLNSIIHQSLGAANTPNRLEPSGLDWMGNDQMDLPCMIPWSEGRFLVWDATCVDTFCESHRQRAVQKEGGVAAHAEKGKARKYAHLDQA